MMNYVEKFNFENAVDQVHWSTARSKSPLIAVAQNSSNIQLIDIRFALEFAIRPQQTAKMQI